ncbi:MAG: 16S rRNA (cytidine(1402)-2'-O)-methyltransferase [Gammaproteobacteria bacterium]|nr:16S rRNA (cytidine(1402)-2'-O)-methyltransferase [Gammaproteobacteria bacterium]
MSKGLLYVVATPIGNLEDVTFRAVKVLQGVDFIAAEDTRHSRPLLSSQGIDTPVLSLHEHNERDKSAWLIERLIDGESLALIADAGTPLINDPGFPLVQQAVQAGIKVVPIPGANAMVCALSAAGLPTNRFLFAGFPPRQLTQRLNWLRALQRETGTLLFYESSHRIIPALSDMAEVFGRQREAVVARELTKLHETFLRGTLEALQIEIERDANQQRGEFVILIHGYSGNSGDRVMVDAEKILEVLSEELPVKQASALTARITGQKKNELYQRILRKKRNEM